MNRINLGKSAPDLYQSIIALDKLASNAIAAAEIENGFAHLLRLRASQLNQCAFCIRMHTRDPPITPRLSWWSRWELYSRWLDADDPALRANAIICLIHQTNFLLDRQISALEQAIIEGSQFWGCTQYPECRGTVPV